jgi:hypothetical protein
VAAGATLPRGGERGEEKRWQLLTNDGLRAVSILTGLTSLNVRLCNKVTRKGVEALRRDTASSNLRIQW